MALFNGSTGIMALEYSIENIFNMDARIVEYIYKNVINKATNVGTFLYERRLWSTRIEEVNDRLSIRDCVKVGYFYECIWETFITVASVAQKKKENVII